MELGGTVGAGTRDHVLKQAGSYTALNYTTATLRYSLVLYASTGTYWMVGSLVLALPLRMQT